MNGLQHDPPLPLVFLGHLNMNGHPIS
jgi:hypothetical protein